ncbi:hypothetical protein L596_002525 [Steinernema carpocapsae]|uniref:Uncharacterized protein n=1 Tax=Steinernema carpocapsae TaxID=34508 RepID=A0A4U8UPV1_STECR|nr:hypothetical protein L596_002525 [Steinernema carpocapsae]
MWILSLFLLIPLLHGSVRAGSITPLRYDLQFQLPTTSKQDTLIPAFLGYAQIDFLVTKSMHSKSLAYAEETPFDARTMFGSFYKQTRQQQGVSLAFDAVNLTHFENVTLENEGRKINIVSVQILKDKVVFVTSESVIQPGRYSLKVERYSGVITYDHGIFYREAGENTVLATQLFPQQARMVFPCIDNISAKTVFKLSLIHPHHTVAISSTIPQEAPSSLNANWKITKFVQTDAVAPHSLAFAILPNEFAQITTGSKLPINIFSNRHTITGPMSFELANLTEHIYREITAILANELPLTQLNILIMSDVQLSRSFGLFTLNYESLERADTTNRIHILTKAIVQQWFGGVTGAPSWPEFCFQDDIAEYISSKVLKKLVDSESYEYHRLVSYLKIQLAETFFAPGETSLLSEPTIFEVQSRCGLKGTAIIESVESVVGEKALYSTIRNLLATFKQRCFTFHDFAKAFRKVNAEGNLNLEMILELWEQNGGQPHLSVSKNDTRIGLRQMNVGRQAKTASGTWASMPLWPLKIELQNVQLPFNFMISQALDMAPVNSPLPFVNIGYRA